MTRYLAPVALLPGGWAENVVLEVSAGGLLGPVEVSPGSPEVEGRLPGVVVPGVVNAHSHAFQRALAGGAETRTGPGDSFWSWREQMYRFLAVLDPDDVEAVAAQLYLELLREGYTRVVEFHYLHRDREGEPYADPAELSRRVVRAAERVGMGITLLPVLYRAGDFGGAPAGPLQRRFVQPVDEFLALLEEVQGWADAGVTPGLALHSLRAVPPEALTQVLSAMQADPGPRHIHLAEQPREVEACLEWSGKRPVEWLLEHAPVDRRWGLVHCTHMTPEERAALAASGATAVVCPTTEANLGDGIFPLPGYLADGGALAIGSDSHVSTSPVEELRWLEYAQRLTRGERAVAGSEDHPSVGRRLLEAVWAGGAAAAGIPGGRLSAGSRADFLVLDPDHPALVGREGDGGLDAWIFSGNRTPVREVWVGGRRVVWAGTHPEEEAVAAEFRRVMRRLRSAG